MNKILTTILIFSWSFSFGCYLHADEDRKSINEVKDFLTEKARKHVIENNLLNFKDKNYEVLFAENEQHWIVYYKEIIPGIDVIGGTPELYFSKETGEIENVFISQ